MKENVEAAIDAAGGVISFGERVSQNMTMLRQGVQNNQLRLAAAGVAASGMYVSGGGNTINRYFHQTINSHEALSPAEMTTEAVAAMKREDWRLP